MRPSVPTRASTRLGTVRPATTLRFDAVGRSLPVGQAVTYEGAVAFVAVTLTTTAPTPAAGTPPRPVTTTSMVPWAATAPPPAARPSIVGRPPRVSSRRAGT